MSKWFLQGNNSISQVQISYGLGNFVTSLEKPIQLQWSSLSFWLFDDTQTANLRYVYYKPKILVYSGTFSPICAPRRLAHFWCFLDFFVVRFLRYLRRMEYFPDAILRNQEKVLVVHLVFAMHVPESVCLATKFLVMGFLLRILITSPWSPRILDLVTVFLSALATTFDILLLKSSRLCLASLEQSYFAWDHSFWHRHGESFLLSIPSQTRQSRFGRVKPCFFRRLIPLRVNVSFYAWFLSSLFIVAVKSAIQNFKIWSLLFI